MSTFYRVLSFCNLVGALVCVFVEPESIITLLCLALAFDALAYLNDIRDLIKGRG